MSSNTTPFKIKDSYVCDKIQKSKMIGKMYKLNTNICHICKKEMIYWVW